MQHLTFKASTTVDTEQGTFTALVSAWEADREGDVIEHTAFDKTIAAWQDSGKQLPLLFEHSKTVVGSVDPASMHPTDAGLVVSGEVDRSTPQGQQVWKQIKSGTAGFSVGFMSEAHPSADGGRILTEIDLLEISATSTPMHPATRALSWKTAGNGAETTFAGIQAASAKAEQAHQEAQRDREIEEIAAKAARRAQPIQVKTFKC